MPNISFRHIRPEDNSRIEQIIRSVMSEFDADPKTTIIDDPVLKKMYESFQRPRSVYYIAEIDGDMIGGCGIAPLDGGDEKTCELQRMFLKKESRGLGIGKMLMEKCISKAKEFGFEIMYLETLSGMQAAGKLYEKSGFQNIDRPIGRTGHSGCNRFMKLPLK